MQKSDPMQSMPLMVGYRVVQVKDGVTKKDILALYKVHLDSEGKVWGLVGQPIFLAEDKTQLDETVVRYIHDLEEGMLQAQLMRAAVLDGGIWVRENFPEPGASNPLEHLLKDPLTKTDYDALPDDNEDISHIS